jgi:hypothetical protein
MQSDKKSPSGFSVLRDDDILPVQELSHFLGAGQQA